MNETLLSILTNTIAMEVFPEAKVNMRIGAARTVTAQATAQAVYRDLLELKLLVPQDEIENRMRETDG